MTDLETRIATWVDNQTAGVQPVTIDEIHDRATTIPIDAEPLPEPPRRFNPRPLTVAATLILIAATIGGAILLLDNDQDNDVITEADQGLAVYLDLIPDDVDRSVELADLEAARASAGVPRPSPGTPIDRSARYFEELADADPLAFWLPTSMARAPGDAPGSEDWIASTLQTTREELGIDLAQVTSWAEWGGEEILFEDASPEPTTIVLTGTFDAEAIERAATENSPAGEEAVTLEHRGVTYFGRHDNINPLGRQQRIGLVDGHVVIAHSDEAMAAIIDRVLDGPAPVPPISLRSALATLLDEVPPDEVIWDIELVHSAEPFGADGPHALATTPFRIRVTPAHDQAHTAVFLFADDQAAAAMTTRYERALDTVAETIEFDTGGTIETSDARARLESQTDLSIDGTVVTFSMRTGPDPEVPGVTGSPSFTRMLQALITGTSPRQTS